MGLWAWRRKWKAIPGFLLEKIAWTEEPGRLPSIGSQELDTAEQLSKTHTPAVKGEIDSDTGPGTSTSHHITRQTIRTEISEETQVLNTH